ncbi:MAG: PaaI family thioesterase [Myxococcaceae bacterium]
MPDQPRRPTPEQHSRYADAFHESLTLKHFGVKIAFEAERVICNLDPIRPEQRGGLGTDAVNGGVLAALFDLAIGCTPALLDPARRTATISLSMHFERPVMGNKLRVEAKIDNAGSSTIFSSAIVYDEHGHACAHAHGISRIGNKPWAAGDNPAIN